MKSQKVKNIDRTSHCVLVEDESVGWSIYPIELRISSKVDTKATIEGIEGNLSPQTVIIRKNEITIFSLPGDLENRESEVVNNYGIHVYSNDPISVSVFVTYKWSGEAFRVTPVEWLGKSYFTLNMYQENDKPGQIIICATEDNTDIQYIPTVETERGIKAGQIGTVELDKGQTFAIKTKVFSNLNRDWETDMSGTHIIASKPIAVISGHTKTCYPGVHINQEDILYRTR